MTALSGVRSSCDMLARNSDLCWLASASSTLCCSSCWYSRALVSATADWLAKAASSSHVSSLNAPGRLAPHDERPDDPVGTHERDGDERAPARPVEHGEVRVERPGRGVEVGDLEHPPTARGPADERPVDVDLRGPQRIDDVSLVP